MIIEIDFNSEEALYLQLCNQIIQGIAMDHFHEGDSLPSVRQLADTIGVETGRFCKGGQTPWSRCGGRYR